MTRRYFLKQHAVFAAGTAFLPAVSSLTSQKESLSFHIFSKHLQFLNYREMAEAAAEIGFDGIDLTVRKGGHVPPEKVLEDLPRAVEAIRSAGLVADMMATDVNNGFDPVHRRVLTTAAQSGIRWYRLGYLNFDDQQSIPARLKDLNLQMQDLATYNRMLGIAGAFQNHAGLRVGSEIWEIWHLLDGIAPDALGCQYDIRHAMVEGGTSWQNGLKLIRPKINCIVLKDFIWEKQGDRWKVVNVPLGEGMVDFDAYFKLLKAYQVQAPVSVHFEYPLSGVEHGARQVAAADRNKIFQAMKRDLDFARIIWENA